MVGLTTFLNAQTVRPNVIHIFADDLSWGSVGYNNPSTFIETPNIDSLALGGMRLNRSYAATVCSPSRANLLTGFHSGHSANDRNGNIGQGLRAQDVTVGEVMTDAGYRSAIVGKWGWGATGNRDLSGPDPEPTINDLESMPALQGYEFFFGYLNHGAAHDFYYSYMWESNQLGGATTTTPNDNGVGGAAEYSHDLVQHRSEELIRDLAAGPEPFFMQVNFTIPHFDLEDIQTTPPLTNLAGDQIFSAGLAQYDGDPNLNDKQERYAAMISRMDASIGAIVARLEDPNFDGDSSDSILDNTVIFFTSDNGATPEDGLGAIITESLPVSGGLRGGKRDLYEGGIRMPAFVHWPGTIAAGSSTELINDLSDFMATAAEIAGTRARVGVDGVSILPTLLGTSGQQQRGHLLFENFENSQLNHLKSSWTLVRQDYKLIQFENGGQELYQVDIDPGENTPLDLSNSVFAGIRDELEQIAFAEGAAQPDAYAVEFRDWVGQDLGSFSDPSNWAVTDEPASSAIGTINETWSARLVNETAGVATATADSSADVLGLEVDAITSHQTLQLGPLVSLSARNEIRIGERATVQLLGSELHTARQITVADGGKIGGVGSVVGTCICRGEISPGAVGVQFEVPPPSGQFSFAVDFSGIDNRAVKDDFYTPLTEDIPQASISLDYGVSAGSTLLDRGFNDFVEEFNLRGWSTGTQVDDAILGNDYLSLKVVPAPGLSVELVDCGFDFFRNGGNSPVNYAVLSNLDGFNASSVLAQAVSNDTSPTRLEADGSAGLNSANELEVRLYGWNANSDFGHTHITGADLELLFTEVDLPELDELATLEFDGSLTLEPSARVIMQIGSDGVDSESDQLVSTGVVAIGGLLQVELFDGYAPNAGDAFDLVVANSINGEFVDVELVTADGVCADDFELVYEADRVTLQFNSAAVRLGDVNLDAAVTFLDIGPFIQVLSSGVFQAEADINKDGTVSFLDISGFIDLLSN
ncbi:UNVERIFIED_CONTAM: hypothetical protein GTU68_053235 [Idotea baltica]|nr:hypothetical protein [Idotea baltica]